MVTVHSARLLRAMFLPLFFYLRECLFSRVLPLSFFSFFLSLPLPFLPSNSLAILRRGNYTRDRKDCRETELAEEGENLVIARPNDSRYAFGSFGKSYNTEMCARGEKWPGEKPVEGQWRNTRECLPAVPLKCAEITCRVCLIDSSLPDFEVIREREKK